MAWEGGVSRFGGFCPSDEPKQPDKQNQSTESTETSWHNIGWVLCANITFGVFRLIRDFNAVNP